MTSRNKSLTSTIIYFTLVATPVFAEQQSDANVNLENNLAHTVNNPAINVVTTVLKKDEQETRRKLMKKLALISSFSSPFSQTVLDEDGNALQKASGFLKVSKPNLVNWHTKTPDENQIISDGQTLWFFDPFIEQVTAYNLSQSTTNTPILLLSSNDDSLWQQYNIEQASDDVFDIYALAQDSQVKKLTIKFKGDALANSPSIEQFVITDASGQISEINLDAFELNPSFTHTTFSFDLADGIHLDDQR